MRGTASTTHRGQAWKTRAGSAISQRGGVVGDVLADETGDEVVAVVVTCAATQGERMRGLPASGFQQFRPQLRVEEFVGFALVDQQGQLVGAIRSGANELAGIPLPPGVAVV